jgi:hypothetical protein
MMANRHRGEISARLDGREWTLCLTLAALADLEAAFGAGDLGALAARLGSGQLTARQLTAIIAAGLRGGGHDVSDGEVAQLRCDGGMVGMAQIAAELISATFETPVAGRMVDAAAGRSASAQNPPLAEARRVSRP